MHDRCMRGAWGFPGFPRRSPGAKTVGGPLPRGRRAHTLPLRRSLVRNRNVKSSRTKRGSSGDKQSTLFTIDNAKVSRGMSDVPGASLSRFDALRRCRRNSDRQDGYALRRRCCASNRGSCARAGVINLGANAREATLVNLGVLPRNSRRRATDAFLRDPRRRYGMQGGGGREIRAHEEAIPSGKRCSTFVGNFRT